VSRASDRHQLCATSGPLLGNARCAASPPVLQPLVDDEQNVDEPERQENGAQRQRNVLQCVQYAFFEEQPSGSPRLIRSSSKSSPPQW
jgi:hypothetical protein